MDIEEATTTNQELLRSLLTQAGVSQARAAVLIAEHTSRPCSPRTVRSWLADASLPSARACPDWAINALKAALSGPHISSS